MSYYTNGTTITSKLPRPLIVDGARIYTTDPAVYAKYGWVPCEPPAPVPEPNPLEPYLAELQSFAAMWMSTGVPITPNWQEAIDALEAADVPQSTVNKLLAYRIALADVWDHVLAYFGSMQ